MRRVFTGFWVALAIFGIWYGTVHAGEGGGAEPGQNTDFAGPQIAQGSMRPCEPNCGQGGAGQRVEEPGGAAHFFRSADANGDGKVSRDEFRGPPQAFKLMDADRDGSITRDEFAAFQKRRESGDLPVRAAPSIDLNLPVVVTHTHILAATDRGAGDMDWAGATRDALARLDKVGIRMAVIMPTPMHPDRSDNALIDGFFEIAREHPDRFVVAAGGASLNGMVQRTQPDGVTEQLRQKFTQRAEELIRRGAIGFGEMTALHFSLFRGHPFEETLPDHPLFLLLADLAAKHDVPIDLHMEAVVQDWPVSGELQRQSSANPERVLANIAALERLLAHNRRARIIWVHVGMDSTGQRTVALTRRLLRENANLFLSITSHQFAIGDDWFFKPGTGLNPRWRKLILEFPDRFMIGTDAFFQPENALRKMPDRMPLALAPLGGSGLPAEVKRKVAFENAQRVYKLGSPAAAARPRDVAATAPTQPRRVAVAAPARRPASAPRFLNEAEIRDIVIGNTLSFDAPSGGQNMFVYFAEDGTAETKLTGQGARTLRKKWSFNAKGMLCRTVGKQNRQHCTRVQSTSDAKTLTLLNQKFRYAATVLNGRSFAQ